jgi:shikimate dehydrogenase
MNTYGLIGKSLRHSFSREYFDDLWRNQGIQGMRYELFEMDDISGIVELLRKRAYIKGFNVTIPFKKEILSFLSSVDETASRMGSVNVVSVLREEQGISLHGFNTDAPAFRLDLQEFCAAESVPLAGNAIVLGNGGAASSVICELRKMGLAVSVYCRTPKKSGDILFTQLSQEELSKASLIIQTTPVGMFPKAMDMLPIACEGFRKGQVLYDLIYNPAVTKLMEEASKRGVRCINGLGMLHKQADMSWGIWKKDLKI